MKCIIGPRIDSNATKGESGSFTRMTHAFLLVFLVAGMLPLPAAEGATRRESDYQRRLRELRSIGMEVARAVLAMDTDTILRFDRQDLREEDRMQLGDRKSLLYCHLFDSSCITWQGRSVFDILQRARQVSISVRDLGMDKDGIQHALVLFYDGASIPKRNLNSAKYLCAKNLKEIVSWTFRYVGDHWEGANPPFDAETDVLCSP